MIEIQKITEHISCFKVPYKDIFVGIYVLRADEGVILFDTAACDADVDNWIAPALEQLGVVPTHIFISHNHSDHAGGIARAAALWPEAVILSRSPKLQEAYPNAKHPEDWRILLDTFQVVNIPGHTADSQALFDTGTGILFTGDCLQAYGIYGEGQWGACIRAIPEHMEALNKLRKMELTNLVMAHDYHPYGNEVYGAEEIQNCLDICAKALLQVKDVLTQHPALSDQEIADLYNADSGLPTVPVFVVEAIRKML